MTKVKKHERRRGYAEKTKSMGKKFHQENQVKRGGMHTQRTNLMDKYLHLQMYMCMQKEMKIVSSGRDRH